jgi:hypothetical protein|tara:strand:+ start:18251 stop:18397 length:147 start_codon:yes stop_codon:yes gene_type:complete
MKPVSKLQTIARLVQSELLSMSVVGACYAVNRDEVSVKNDNKKHQRQQ